MKIFRSITIIFLFLSGMVSIGAEAQLLPTGMRITVLNRMGNVVENAKVTVFSNRGDYENGENAVAGPAFTDKKGRVTFKNLEAKKYYVQVTKGDESNYGEAEQTGVLIKGKINKFNIIIE